MIELHAPIAMRSHDELVLPDANGKPIELKALFDTPRDLLAALIRGGWIIPGASDRSMFLVAIIGTGANSRADEIGALASRSRASVPVDRRRRRHTRRGDLIVVVGSAAWYCGVAAARRGPIATCQRPCIDASPPQ